VSQALALPPADHVRLLHPVGRRGVATIAARGVEWIERAVPIADLAEYARALRGATDIYVSQQGFWGWRRIAQLAQLGAVYSDLDYRNTTWSGETPERVTYAMLTHLDDAKLPTPSFVLATGRGLLATWLHDPVPRGALPRWMAAQHALQRALAPFGADARAMDAARVFRLSGTRHSVADAEVRCIWPGPASDLARYPFDDIMAEILPLGRADLVALRVRRAERRATGEGSAPAKRLTAASLWETTLTDLQRLRQLRWFGSLPPGQRDTWMLLAATAMSWLAPVTVLPREVHALGIEAGGWGAGEAKARLSSVVTRAEAAARGVRMQWNGRAVDPRYRFRAATMVEWLGITPAEMREANLRLLIDRDVARERATERQHEHRRRIGVRERSGYEADAAERAAVATILRAEGLTWIAVGDRMGVSADAARFLADRAQARHGAEKQGYATIHRDRPDRFPGGAT
jgi:hypothetical protein